jgi:hypothetical protein
VTYFLPSDFVPSEFGVMDFSIAGFGNTKRGNSQLPEGFIAGICIPKLPAQNSLKTHVILENTNTPFT